MTFIDKIVLQNVRNIPHAEILLDANVKKHLILTGPNGSGKTTVINELKNYMEKLISKVGSYYEWAKKDAKVTQYEDIFTCPKADIYRKVIREREQAVCDESLAIVSLTSIDELFPMYLCDDYLISVFDAHRKTSFVVPKGPSKIERKPKSKEDFGKYFIQLLVNLRTQRSFARDNNDEERVKNTDQWFDTFNKALEKLLGHSDFELHFDYNNFIFTIKEKDKEPYHFTELSDGYSALLYIVSELMIRMSEEPVKSYDKQGIVFIDEIENHLHVELQKKVLPFLTELFPNIQFIVTTHSPFVLSSVKNSVIFDLKKLKQYEDFSEYSYSGIIENYFDTNLYSNQIVNEIRDIEELLKSDTLKEDDINRIKKAYDSIDSGKVSVELQLKLRSLILKNYSKLYGVL